MAFLRAPVGIPRLFKVGRTGLIGRQPPPARGTAVLSADVDTSKLGHVARRRIAAPPMAKIEAAVEAVGSALQAWADRFIAAVMQRTIPDLLDRADSINGMLHQDASVEEVFASLDDPKVAKSTLESTFRAVDKASSDDLRVVGVRTGSVVPNADRLQSEWIDRNVNLIKAQRDVVSRVQKVIAEAVPQGKSVADIRKLLEEQAGYARSRAELTARDQTLKLYGQIQQERQQAAGFTHYVWTTSLDERVREEHAELDGQVIAWDDPPVVDRRTGRREHPGGDYQCRCSAVPYTGDDVAEVEEPEALPDVPFEVSLPEPPDLQARAAEAAQARIEQERLQRRAVLGVDPPVVEEAVEAAARARVVEISERLPQVDSEAVRESRRRRFLREQRLVDDVRATTTQAYDQMPFEQKAALDEYTGGNFRAMRALDLGATPAEVVELGIATAKEAGELATQLESFREAQQRLTVYRPTDRGALYRGISIKSQSQLEQLLKSETIEFTGSVNSASYNHSVADGFAAEGGGAKVILEMPHVDKAVSAIYDSNGLVHEYEMIVGKSKWRVVSKRFDAGMNTYLVELEQILVQADATDEKPAKFGSASPNKFVSDGSDLKFA